VVVALGFAQIVAWGSIYYAFALLIEPLAAATGSSRATVVGAFSAALLAAGAVSPWIGRRIDRHGGRAVMVAGSVAAGLLLALLGQVRTVWQLYLVWLGLGVTMAATLYDPAFAVLTQLFRDRQRQAITALTLFGGFASTVFWPLTQWLVAGWGWQAALMVLGALNLLVSAPLQARWVPTGSARPSTPPSGASGEPRPAPPALRRDPRFWSLCAAFTGNALVFSAMSVHLIPLLHAKGLTLAAAAWVGAMIGPMQVAGRLAEFTLLRRASAARVGLFATALLPLSLLVFAVLQGPAVWFLLFALLYGAANGVMTIVRGAMPRELYGDTHYGAVNGAMALPVLLAKAAGPMAAALLMQAAATPAQVVTAMAVVGAVSVGLFAWAARASHLRGAARGV